LFAKLQLLLLDEATAVMDRYTEQTILNLLANPSPGNGHHPGHPSTQNRLHLRPDLYHRRWKIHHHWESGIVAQRDKPV